MLNNAPTGETDLGVLGTGGATDNSSGLTIDFDLHRFISISVRTQVCKDTQESQVDNIAILNGKYKAQASLQIIRKLPNTGEHHTDKPVAPVEGIVLLAALLGIGAGVGLATRRMAKTRGQAAYAISCIGGTRKWVRPMHKRKK